jgi:flagellar basal-body rod protein FlgB
VSLFTGVQNLHQALDYHLERHNVLMANVSNVDTPGYIPHDIARTEGFQGVMQVTMQATQAGHLGGAASGAPTTGRVFDDPAAGAGNDQNYVSLDREATKVAANGIRYDVISTIVAAELEGLAFAANDGKYG